MRLQRKLASGEFVILAEMEPPKGTDVAAMVANAANVKRQVDAYVIPEMSNAVMKMSSLGGALLLQSKGLETVLQCCCRDRNRLALQADLLAAQALGVPNVMAVSGEEITHGDHHQARAVNDLNLLELLGAIQTLQTGRDLAGVDLQGAPSFFVGATVKIPASDGDTLTEMRELDKKIAAGASFFITPPVYEVAALAKFAGQSEGPAGRHHPHRPAPQVRGHGPLYQPAPGAQDSGGVHQPDSEGAGPGAGMRADRRGNRRRPEGQGL